MVLDLKTFKGFLWFHNFRMLVILIDISQSIYFSKSSLIRVIFLVLQIYLLESKKKQLFNLEDLETDAQNSAKPFQDYELENYRGQEIECASFGYLVIYQMCTPSITGSEACGFRNM